MVNWWLWLWLLGLALVKCTANNRAEANLAEEEPHMHGQDGHNDDNDDGDDDDGDHDHNEVIGWNSRYIAFTFCLKSSWLSFLQRTSSDCSVMVLSQPCPAYLHTPSTQSSSRHCAPGLSPITAINVGKFSRAPTRQEKARNVNTNVTESLKCQIVMHQIWPFSTQEPNLCKRRKIFYLHHQGSSSFNGCNLTSNIIFHPPKWLDWNKRDVRNKRMEKYTKYLVRAVPSSDNLSLLLSLCLSLCLSLYQYYCICLCLCHCAKYLVEAAPSLDNLSGFDRFLAEREAFEA